MIDLFLLAVSVAVHGAASGSGPAEGRPPAEAAASAVAEEAGKGAPIFLAPPDDNRTAAAPPAFPSPSDDGPAAAPPAFPSPSDNGTAAAPPVFLAPGDGGPAGLVAEPQVPTGRFTIAAEVKPILSATRANWIAVREFDGQDLLYVTHLWSWRCGLLQMKLGVNGAAPEIWPLPPCHDDMAAANAILDSDGPPYRAFPLGSVQWIDVHLTYDDLSTDQARFDRGGVEIP